MNNLTPNLLFLLAKDRHRIKNRNDFSSKKESDWLSTAAAENSAVIANKNCIHIPNN